MRREEERRCFHIPPRASVSLGGKLKSHGRGQKKERELANMARGVDQLFQPFQRHDVGLRTEVF